MSTHKERLDLLVVRRGLAKSRERAKALVMAGKVIVDGKVMDKPGMSVSSRAEIRVVQDLPYVSRGGLKLEAALDAFGVDVSDQTAVDVGASTGGFTDCLLQRGARRVYAIDVGYGQFDWSLRQNPLVVTMERTNIRYVQSLPEPIDIAVVDVSFISLRLVLPPVRRLLTSPGDAVVLIKPQFEAGREQVGKGGVVRDLKVHEQVLRRVAEWAPQSGFWPRGFTTSPIKGPAGNVEYFAHLSKVQEEVSIEEAIRTCLDEAGNLGAGTMSK
jgi:23S rRNA (cytidine1920-2'-O)/16S rRNA (cytidine1409-2'-O)-methyltransferase